MALSRTTEAYIGFLKIADKAYAEKIRYFEDNSSVFRVLPEEEKFELNLSYTLALFEVGAYEKYLKTSDILIEWIFAENIITFKGKDVARQLLFRKACCLYNTQKYGPARKLATQVYRMYPDSPQNKILLRNIIYKIKEPAIQNIRAGVVVMYIVSAIIIAVHLFLIQPFYSEYAHISEFGWQGVFGFASLLLLGTEMYLRFVSSKEVERSLPK